MKKVIFSNNSVLSDITKDIERYNTGSSVVDYTATQDFIYIGDYYPFNSFYTDFITANTQATSPSISYWDGSSWISAIEVIDGTNGFNNKGYITFVPNKNNGWTLEDTVDSSGSENITGLGGVTIYDRYWIRVSFNNSMDALTELKYIGHKFCIDSDLYSEFPEFNNSDMLTGFAAGKTNWDEQQIVASRLVMDNLINRQIISYDSQLLDKNELIRPCVSKTAEIIYKSLGDDYKDDKSAAEIESSKRLNKVFKVDKNKNATLDIDETKYHQGKMYR